jgi:hypothetical protein
MSIDCSACDDLYAYTGAVHAMKFLIDRGLTALRTSHDRNEHFVEHRNVLACASVRHLRWVSNTYSSTWPVRTVFAHSIGFYLSQVVVRP